MKSLPCEGFFLFLYFYLFYKWEYFVLTQESDWIKNDISDNQWFMETGKVIMYVNDFSFLSNVKRLIIYLFDYDHARCPPIRLHVNDSLF
jgi:hypothetical protein